LYARQLLSSKPLTASADLSLNTLSHFLDRFVYKNPKKTTKGGGEVTSGGKARGTSAMQPAATAADGAGVKLLKGEVEDAEAVHGEMFLRRRLQDVPVDQVRFCSKKVGPFLMIIA
jgi:ribosome biogenesis protein MAK21